MVDSVNYPSDLFDAPDHVQKLKQHVVVCVEVRASTRIRRSAVVGAYIIVRLLLDNLVSPDSVQVVVSAVAVSIVVGAAAGRWWILLIPPMLVGLLLLRGALVGDFTRSEGGWTLAIVLAMLYVAVADICLAVGVTVRKLAGRREAGNHVMRGGRSRT